jgi:hypothetical protein
MDCSAQGYFRFIQHPLINQGKIAATSSERRAKERKGFQAIGTLFFDRLATHSPKIPQLSYR